MIFNEYDGVYNAVHINTNSDRNRCKNTNITI